MVLCRKTLINLVRVHKIAVHLGAVVSQTGVGGEHRHMPVSGLTVSALEIFFWKTFAVYSAVF